MLHADDAIRYRVEVVAPAAIAATFAGAIDLIRWQDYEDMTEDLFDRLARDAVPQAKEAAATQGYFSANVEITVDRSTQPVTVTLAVTPQLPTRIASVHIDVAGPANDAPEGQAAIAKLRDEWLLPKGDIFRQEAWTAAKNLAVATLAASPYAAAKLTSSEARIDPPAHSADLDVSIASGPPFRVGDVAVQGLKKYTPDLVQQFATVHTGDLYSERVLDDYARRLLASGYFASVQASIDPDPAQADDAKVTLSIIEAPAKRLEFGAGYSTDTQYQVSASYSDVNIDDHGLQFFTSARIETQGPATRCALRAAAGAGRLDRYLRGQLAAD